MSEPSDRVRRQNFRAVLAQLVTEHLPVDDPYTNEMIDVAWRIADRLEGRFLDEFELVKQAARVTTDEGPVK